MAKVKELEDQELKLQKVELECIDKEHDLWLALDLLPSDVVVCDFETIDVEYIKPKKKNEITTITQERHFAGGFFESVFFNSEGYSESLKLTIKGKK